MKGVTLIGVRGHLALKDHRFRFPSAGELKRSRGRIIHPVNEGRQPCQHGVPPYGADHPILLNPTRCERHVAILPLLAPSVCPTDPVIGPPGLSVAGRKALPAPYISKDEIVVEEIVVEQVVVVGSESVAHGPWG
jgi:hypothetical protein